MSVGLSTVAPAADVIGQKHALNMNISAALGLQSVLKSNFGPRGTMKMLVSGGGAIKITKDGKALLDEMTIQHPTASIIARTATAQDDITGDGTTANVLFTGEILKQCQRYLSEGVHPRLLVEGIEKARERILEELDKFAREFKEIKRDLMTQVARTSLRTKLQEKLADHLTEIVVDAISCIYEPGQPLDLHMIEVMTMRHRTAMDTTFVNGIVLDHGARHPDMAKRSENCKIFICNVSLEYEKTLVNSGFYYKSAEERVKLSKAERKVTDDRVKKIIALKEQACKKDESFIIINQKGIDPLSLEMLQKAGIVGIRRAKRRNMERLARACGGYAVNSLEDLKEDCLGYAKTVYEHTLGEDKYTFVEGCKHATSCTVLIRGPNEHTIKQIQDALRDGERAVNNFIEDKSLVPGAGAFELFGHIFLSKFAKEVEGKARCGVHVFADALLVIPKTLAENSSLDMQTTVRELLVEAEKGNKIGIDIETGQPILPDKLGIWDNTRVKRQFLHLGSMVAIKLLLVDEVIRAGKKMGQKEDES